MQKERRGETPRDCVRSERSICCCIDVVDAFVQPSRNNKSHSQREKALAIRRSSTRQEASSLISSNLPKLSSWLTHLCSLLFLLAVLLLTINKPCQSVLVYFDDDDPSWSSERGVDAHHLSHEQVKQDCNQSQTSQQPNKQRRRPSSDSPPTTSSVSILSTADAQQQKQKQRRRLSASQQSDKQQPCHDCLAIPLVAIMDDRQISGYLIPPLVQPQARSLDRRPAMDDGQSMFHRKEAIGRQYQQQHNYSQQAAMTQRHHDVEPHSLEPKSDEHCPMTGPLTVCDQINSYPNDVILNKLEGAKRTLKQSYFNLDSLFSDERDHSSEPFSDDQLPASRGSGGAHRFTEKPPTSTRGAHHHRQHPNSWRVEPHYGYQGGSMLSAPNEAQKVEKPTAPSSGQSASSAYERREQRSANNQHHSPASLANIDHGMGEGAINYNVALAGSSRPIQEENQGKPESRNVHSSKSNHDTDQSLGHWKVTIDQRQSKSSSDDFVDLVERNAFSLRPNKQLPTSTTSPPLYKPADSLSSISNTTLVNKLLSTLNRADRDRYQANRAGSDSSIHLETYNDDGSQQLNDNEQELLAAGASTNKHQRSIKTAKRPRRQVPGRVSSGNGAELQSDPDNVATEGDNGAGNNNAGDAPALPEPICKAKSIYISPRAALNDKKQWKYVVNAPGRIPQIRQIIRVDICQDPFGPCSDQVNIPFGFISQCKQKYSKKKLLALDSRSGLLEVDTFFIPSCCVCQLIRESRRPLDDISTIRPLPEFDFRLNAQPLDNNSGQNGDSSRSAEDSSDPGASRPTDTAQLAPTDDSLTSGSSRIPF